MKSAISVRRVIPYTDLEQSRIPAYVVLRVVTEMQAQMYPLTCRTTAKATEHGLLLIMDEDAWD